MLSVTKTRREYLSVFVLADLFAFSEELPFCVSSPVCRSSSLPVSRLGAGVSRAPSAVHSASCSYTAVRSLGGGELCRA